MTTKVDPVTLCITSGKGGVGKTSLAVNLAFALAKKGTRVLVVDGDLGLANVDVLLGLTVKRTIRDVLDSGADPLETVIHLERNLGVLPASSGVPEMVTLGPEEQNRLGTVLTSIASHFDYALMDTAAGIGPSVLWFNRFVGHNMIVLSSDPTSLTDSYALIKILSRDYNRKHFHLVVNFVNSDVEGRETYEILEKVAKKFLDLDLNYLGTVPDDRAVQKAARKQHPFIQDSPQSKAAQALIFLADRIQELKTEPN
jgi:flagellar biosynthesis protein FlhG